MQYTLKYRDATKITGQLIAAAELRLAICFNELIAFHKREIRHPARLLYHKYPQYYDNKAAAIKDRLAFNDMVVDQPDVVMLCGLIFRHKDISDAVYDIVDHYTNCYEDH